MNNNAIISFLGNKKYKTQNMKKTIFLLFSMLITA